jgi:hypothetical protein
MIALLENARPNTTEDNMYLHTPILPLFIDNTNWCLIQLAVSRENFCAHKSQRLSHETSHTSTLFVRFLFDIQLVGYSSIPSYLFSLVIITILEGYGQ